MGVDSGLPDFRSQTGFWKAYPPAQQLGTCNPHSFLSVTHTHITHSTLFTPPKPGLSFHEMADPSWFHKAPAIAWGFYGHRLNMYRSITPHTGFDVLRRWTVQKQHRLRAKQPPPPQPAVSAFYVLTSNVDGQFQAAWQKPQPQPAAATTTTTTTPSSNSASLASIVEVHGSVHHLQCLHTCHASQQQSPDGSGVWPAPHQPIKVQAHRVNSAYVAPTPALQTVSYQPTEFVVGWMRCVMTGISPNA
jgi:NAD-dependent SIR2 family protein deacetylase